MAAVFNGTFLACFSVVVGPRSSVLTAAVSLQLLVVPLLLVSEDRTSYCHTHVLRKSTPDILVVLTACS